MSDNHPACKTVDFKQQPICEVRNPDDMRALSANVGISGSIQVSMAYRMELNFRQNSL